MVPYCTYAFQSGSQSPQSWYVPLYLLYFCSSPYRKMAESSRASKRFVINQARTRLTFPRCEISHPAPESLSSNRTSRTTSYTNLRKRSDSMSFDTEHTSLDSDTNSKSLSDSSETTTTNEHGSSTHVDKCAIPGSPWRDPVRLEDLPKVDADILGQSLRHITRKRIRADPPRAQREEAGNALYVKGSQEVPLESRIESSYFSMLAQSPLMADAQSYTISKTRMATRSSRTQTAR